MSERPKALFLSPESPYPIFGGGALRSASILEYLLARYDTDVFAFNQPAAKNTPRTHTLASPPRPVRRWTTMDLPYHTPGALQRGLRNTFRVLRRVPPLVDRFAGFEDALRQAIAGQHYAVAVVEHFWCAPYASVLRPHCDRLVLDLHNIESLWHRRSALGGSPAERWAHRSFARAAEALERRWLPSYDLILAASQPECHFVTNQLANAHVTVVKNTIPFHALPEVPKRDLVVFSGNMEYAPNQNAARYFAAGIWPILSSRRKETRWALVGKAADRLMPLIATAPRTDYVSDPEDAMIEIATASVAVVPLLVGTGTRLKIVEAWAAGTPVVSTTVGAEGLECEPGHDLLIADDPERFAESVIRLLENPELARDISRNGRRRYESAYTWQNAWDALSAWNV